MFRISQERFKLYILIFLIFTSIIQIGILWSEQYHGLPINFLMRYYRQVIPISAVPGVQNAIDTIRPVRIVLSYDESHWIISKKSANYERIWEDGRRYIRMIMSVKQSAVKSEPYSEGLWKELVSKNGIYFEFQTGIRQSLLGWFLNVTHPVSPDPPAVYKMILAPWVNMNYNQTTLYIYDGVSIYTYTLSVPAGGINKDFYKKLAIQLAEDKSIVSYNVIKEFNLPFVVGPDVFFNVKSPKTLSLKAIKHSVPDVLKTEKASVLDELAKAILGGGEKDNYDLVLRESPELAEFKNLNNIYRVNRQGLLEYRYLQAADPVDKGQMEQAYAVVQNFMSRIIPLIPSDSSEIVLSGYGRQELGDSYEFTFDYRVNELPVTFVDVKDSNDKTMANSITIRANSKRVLECSWLMKKFELVDEVAYYNIGFTELLKDFTVHYPTQRWSRNVSIKDITIGYRIQGDSGQQPVEPSCILRIDDNASGKKNALYVIPMQTIK